MVDEKRSKTINDHRRNYNKSSSREDTQIHVVQFHLLRVKLVQSNQQQTKQNIDHSEDESLY